MSERPAVNYVYSSIPYINNLLSKLFSYRVGKVGLLELGALLFGSSTHACPFGPSSARPARRDPGVGELPPGRSDEAGALASDVIAIYVAYAALDVADRSWIRADLIGLADLLDRIGDTARADEREPPRRTSDTA